MKVTLEGSVTLVRPASAKAEPPIEITDLQCRHHPMDTHHGQHTFIYYIEYIHIHTNTHMQCI